MRRINQRRREREGTEGEIKADGGMEEAAMETER